MSHGSEHDDIIVVAGGIANAPWHYSLTKDRTRIHDGETITAEQIMDLAGLDWQVAAKQMYAKVGDGWTEADFVLAEDHFATVREDTRKFLGVVSPDYQIVQNRSLKELLQEVVDEANAKFVTAGSLRGNRVVWFLMQMPNSIKIAGMPSEDGELYLLGTTGHGAKYGREMTGLSIKSTYVRVVCQNTLGYALGDGRMAYTLRHVGDVVGKLSDIRKAIGMAENFGSAIQDMANKLVQIRYSEEDLAVFLDRLLPVPHVGDAAMIESRKTWATNKKADILNTLIRTEDLAPIRETNWGLVQAVSGYEAHGRRYGSPERKFEVTMGLGTEDSLTTKAVKVLTSERFLNSRASADVMAALADAEKNL